MTQTHTALSDSDAHIVVVVVAVLVVLVMPFARRLGWLGWLALHVVGATLALPPLINIVLRCVGVVGGLPEASGQLGLAFVSAAATLVVVYLANEAGKTWST